MKRVSHVHGLLTTGVANIGNRECTSASLGPWLTKCRPLTPNTRCRLSSTATPAWDRETAATGLPTSLRWTTMVSPLSSETSPETKSGSGRHGQLPDLGDHARRGIDGRPTPSYGQARHSVTSIVITGPGGGSRTYWGYFLRRRSSACSRPSPDSTTRAVPSRRIHQRSDQSSL
jgi:hypothetical protein